MAQIVAGFATSFSPQLHVPPEMWATMGERDSGSRSLLGTDGKSHSYDELLEMADPSVQKAIQPEEQAKRHKACQEHLATIGRKMRETQLDALVYFADDEHALFDVDNWPAVLCVHGDTVPYIPRPVNDDSPPQVKAAAWAYGEEPVDWPGSPDLGDHILRHLTANDLELSRSTKLREGKSLGHHLGFMNTRLLEGKQVPTVPFVINGKLPTERALAAAALSPGPGGGGGCAGVAGQRARWRRRHRRLQPRRDRRGDGPSHLRGLREGRCRQPNIGAGRSGYRAATASHACGFRPRARSRA